MPQKYRVGILGATGTVGQRFVQLLRDHPWFELGYLAASERSSGKSYREACDWKLATAMPGSAGDIVIEEPLPGNFDGRIVFSGLTGDVAGPIEEEFAQAGHAVISNASSHRLDADVPLVIPEINPHHLGLIEQQRSRRGYGGFIVTNPNCSTIALALALAPLEEAFGVKRVFVTTLQALSGAGYPGVPSLDALGNVIPYIAGEEEKIEAETVKIFGDTTSSGDGIDPHPMRISAHTTRVPVRDGHTATVSIELEGKPEAHDVKGALQAAQSPPQVPHLPSAPSRPIVLLEGLDRPQPRLDVEREGGMATAVGRVRACPIFDVRLVILSHNTVRGAAGAALLNAELLHSQGYFDSPCS